jgi:hypothetical protein
MEHWFDHATRLLASGSISRRNALKTAALGFLGAVVPEVSWPEPLLDGAQSPQPFSRIPPPVSTPRGTGNVQSPAQAAVCIRESRGGETTITLAAVGSYLGKSLTLQTVVKSDGGRLSPLHFDQRADLGNYLVYEMSVHLDGSVQKPKPGTRTPSIARVAAADVRYGPAVRGPRHLHVTATGESVRGFADGRALCDGECLRPPVAMDPGLQESIRALSARARQALPNCIEARPTATPAGAVSANVTSSARFAYQQSAGSGEGRSDNREARLELASFALPERPAPAQGGGTDCQLCLSSCMDQVVGSLVVDGIAWLVDPTSGFLGLLGAGTAFDICEYDCSKPGAACCSVSCGDSFCCGTGQSCCGSIANPGGPVCCDPGSVCTTVKDPLYGPISFCCPSGSDTNGCLAGGPLEYSYLCRTPGQECCGPWGPCPQGQFCGSIPDDLCCPNGTVACNSGAYLGWGEYAAVCCNGTCITHNSGTTAQYQECCPHPNVACGESCCAPGAHCLTTSKGQKVCCDQTALCGDVCCDWPATCTNGVCGVGACGDTFCGLFDTCCNGACCTLNETCVNGKCMGTQCPAGETPCPYMPGQCCPSGFVCCGIGVCCDPKTTVCCGGRGCVPIGQCVIVN